jgi:hypothetical protein
MVALFESYRYAQTHPDLKGFRSVQLTTPELAETTALWRY